MLDGRDGRVTRPSREKPSQHRRCAERGCLETVIFRTFNVVLSFGSRARYYVLMHVFIDTNILLNFFHFTNEELDALNNVFASHKHGAAQVYLTEQVRDEFRRNREAKIKDALKRFKETKFSAQLPSFMKAYSEYNEIKKLSSALQEKSKAIMDKANVDVHAQTLVADTLIKQIFDKSQAIETKVEIFEQASRRTQIGNPPGKNGSVGDAINWIVLLTSVPGGNDLHIISEDGDFFSQLDEKRPHPFLMQEWTEKKRSSLCVYRTLSEFLTAHFDGVAFSFDKDKEALIDSLEHTGSFATTHNIVAKLEAYAYFSLKEVERILQAAEDNTQFGWIVTDYDVSDFLNRVTVPRRNEINRPEFLAVIDKVIEEQKNRNEF